MWLPAAASNLAAICRQDVYKRQIITNMCGDDVLYASGNYGDHEFSGMLNEFRYDAEAEVPKLDVYKRQELLVPNIICPLSSCVIQLM